MTGLDLVVNRAGRELAEAIGQLFRAARRKDQLVWLRSSRAAVLVVTRVRDERSPAAALDLLVEELCARARTVIALIDSSSSLLALVGLPAELYDRMAFARSAIDAMVHDDIDELRAMVDRADQPLSFGLQLLFDLVQISAMIPGADAL